jgi:hypothetical protein
LSKTSGDKEAGVKVLDGSISVNLLGQGLKKIEKSQVVGSDLSVKLLASLDSASLNLKTKLSPLKIPLARLTLPKTPHNLIAIIQKDLIPQQREMPSVEWPKSGQILWAVGSLKTRKEKTLDVIIKIPTEASYNSVEKESWRGFLNLGKKASGSKYSFAFLPGTQTAKIPAKIVRSKSRKQNSGDGKKYTLSMRTGITVDGEKSEKSNKNTYSDRRSQIEIRSLQDLPESSYLLTLNGLTTSKNVRNPQWIEQKRRGGFKKKTLISLELPSKKLLLAMVPLLVNSKSNFKIEKVSSSFSESGVYFANNNGVQAKVITAKLTTDKIVILRSLLRTNLVFEGRGSAYLPTVKSFSQLNKELSKLKNKKKVHLYTQGKIVSVKKDLISKAPKAIESLFGNAELFFVEKVKIIDVVKNDEKQK